MYSPAGESSHSHAVALRELVFAQCRITEFEKWSGVMEKVRLSRAIKHKKTGQLRFFRE